MSLNRKWLFFIGLAFIVYVVNNVYQCLQPSVYDKDTPLDWVCLCVKKEKAKSGDIGAIVSIGDHYNAVDGDYQRALPWLKRAAIAGVHSAIIDAIAMCERSMEGIDSTFIAQSFAVAKKQEKFKSIEKLENSWKNGEFPKCPYKIIATESN